jgi:hypothetical protein|tara:strand:+ start:2339 stop:2716 length:378 start_codon:yes stop_codon:yes gene_type:complete
LKDSFPIPGGVKREAKQGTALRAKFGYGGGDVTLKVNRLLTSQESVGIDTAMRIYKYYARHAPVDPKGINFHNRKRPSKGYIMWKLMGGNSGHQWSRKLEKQIAVRTKGVFKLVAELKGSTDGLV